MSHMHHTMMSKIFCIISTLEQLDRNVEKINLKLHISYYRAQLTSAGILTELKSGKIKSKE